MTMQTQAAVAEAIPEIEPDMEDMAAQESPGAEVGSEEAAEAEAAIADVPESAELPAPGDEPEARAEPGDAESEAQAAAPVATITRHPRADRNQHLRIVEAVLFAAAEPVDAAYIGGFLPDGTDVAALLADLQANFANRGVNLVEVAGKWLFRTSEDLGYILRREKVEERKLSKAAMETLAIIAYHQPVTRAEIEDIRGVAISKGTLDQLLEIGWVRMRGRRKTPGRPVTYGTTDAFLSHFGLNEVSDLPGLQELKGAGLLDANLPPGFDIPMPKSGDELAPDEEPLDGTEEQIPLEMHLPEQAEGGEPEAS